MATVVLLVGSKAAWAETASLYPPATAAVADESGPASKQGWAEFLKERTQFGIGFDQTYEDNVFYTRSSQKQEDFITTLESQLAFADPKGDWLYGGSYEINAFRYLHLVPNQTGFHHEWLAYAYYTPLARYRFTFSLGYRIDDRLVQVIQATDEIRRFSRLTRAATTTAGWSGTYDLNPTNALVLSYGFNRFDDQAKDDENVDNMKHSIGLSLDHDLTNRLTLFGGFSYSKTNFPRASSKDTTDAGIDFGAKYDLDPSTAGKLQFRVSKNEIKNGTSSTEFGVLMEFRRQVNERSLATLTLQRTTVPTVTGIAENVTSNYVMLKWEYELTKIIKLETAFTYSHAETDRSRSDASSAEVAFIYPIRQDINANVSYKFEQYEQREVHNHTVTIGVEAQLW